MKKLFISCPMRGRTEENIKDSMEKMHKIAELMFGEELELIQSYLENENPPENANEKIWYLGKSLELLAEADYFIGPDYCSDVFSGCDIEREVANNYGIQTVTVNIYRIMPDLRGVEETLRGVNERKIATCR